MHRLTPVEPPPSATVRYDRGAILFHWTVAVLVAVVVTIGVVHDSLPEDDQPFWINLHALIGLSLLAVVLARLWWRATHKPPALPPGTGALSRRLSSPVHMLLYVLLVVIPLLGIVTFIWHGRGFDFGLFSVDFGVPKNRAVFEPTEDVQSWLAYTLFTVVGLHALAALWHQFYRRDGLLLRMWPARRNRDSPPPP
ncbi:MAG: cytochrome b [Steroidobacteraceae bacterium]